MAKGRYLLITILFLSYGTVHAQGEDVHDYYHVSFSQGFIIPHRTSIVPLVTGHVQALELSWGKQMTGKKQWHINYGFPEMGFTFYYADLSNHALGKAYALFPYLNLSLYQGKIKGKLKCGTGLVYLSKRYDKFENRKNVAIATHINFTLDLDWMNEIHISEQWKVALGIGMIHYSNGAFVSPNLGLNTPAIKASVIHKIPTGIKDISSPLNEFDFEKALTFRLNWGLRGKGIESRDKYQAITINSFVEKRIVKKGSIGLGMDYFLSEFVSDKLAEVNGNDKLLKSGRMGLTGGYTFYLERMSFALQLGNYLIDPYGKDGNIYSRYGFAYCLNRNLQFNLTLKSHLLKAEYIEFGFGYRFLKEVE